MISAETNPLVSVIIPCFNGEAYVGDAIESALAQTYRNVEVIVVDDGSTDRSLRIIRSYGDHIRWENTVNRGGGAARNRGLELARGEYIQFLDSDDWLLEDKVRAQVELSRSFSNAIPCSGRYQDDKKIEIKSCRKLNLEKRELESLAWVIKETQNMRTSAPLHRRKSLESVGGFDEEITCAQEYDLHIRLAASGLEFEYDPTPLWGARTVIGSVSSATGRVLDQHPRIFARARQLAESRSKYSIDVAEAIAHVLMTDARWYSLNGNPRKMRAFHALAAIYDKHYPRRFYRDNRVLYWTAKGFGSATAEQLVRWRRRR